MIKVALIGTHGVGKTTICYNLVGGLKKRGVSADYLGEIAREARKSGFRINEETTQDSQRWILHTQIAKELEFAAGKNVEILVCDRSVLDNYAYFINSFGIDPALDAIINSHMKTYNLLFKAPINPAYLSQDNVRSIEPVFQKKIDLLVERELKERNIEFLVYKGLEDAILRIERILQKNS